MFSKHDLALKVILHQKVVSYPWVSVEEGVRGHQFSSSISVEFGTGGSPCRPLEDGSDEIQNLQPLANLVYVHM